MRLITYKSWNFQGRWGHTARARSWVGRELASTGLGFCFYCGWGEAKVSRTHSLFFFF